MALRPDPQSSVNAANDDSLLSANCRPFSFTPPVRTETTHSRAPEIIPKTPKAGSNVIFRITGIPLHAVEGDLMDILMDEFDTENGIITNANGLKIWPSCYDDRTQTALLEFTPREPSMLLDYLKDKSNKGYLISHPAGGDMTIDQDFHGLTQLYPTSGPIKADIVAVSGLDGHAYGSWAGKEDNRGIRRMWLRDFLGEDLPCCRTMIYGYDSRLKTLNGLREIPNYTDLFLEELMKARRTPEEKNRPIVFIGHGFGGILIAEAVVKAKANIQKYGALFKNTKATIFYATPIRELVVDDIVCMTGDDSRQEDLLNSLRHRSEGDLHRFKDCISPYGLRIISYKGTKLTPRLIEGENGEWVRKGDIFDEGVETSAILHLPASLEDTLEIDGDHSTLVKFQYKAQLSYTSVLRQIEECTNDTGLARDTTAESAVMSGTDYDLARILEHGTVDVNAPLKHLPNSPTLLHIATSINDGRKIEVLLENGADIEARDSDGATALHKAIASKNAKIVQLLLGNGARNPTEGFSPTHNWMYELPLLHFACAEGNSEIVRMLVAARDTSLKDSAGPRKHYPIHFAAVNEDVSVLEMLTLEVNVDTEVADGKGETALHLAAARGLESSVRSLLLHGASTKATDPFEQTPLHIAIESENDALVNILLDNGADITAVDASGNTPLHYACRMSSERLAKSLLDRNAEIEAKNRLKMTPLLCAAQSGSKPVFELLARNKADLTAVCRLGKGALHLAMKNGGQDLLESILSYGADIEARDDWGAGGTPLYAAASAKNGPAAQVLLRRGASTTAKGASGMTPLHIAVLNGSYEVTKHLLDYRASVQARDNFGDTPLHHAAMHGHKEIVSLLLEHKADKEARNFRFSRPIDEARRERNIACVNLLKEISWT